jgi:hypothetical protein
MKISRRYFHEA